MKCLWLCYEKEKERERESHSTLILKVNIFARHRVISMLLCVYCKLPPFSGSEIKVMRLLFFLLAHSETTLIWFSCLYNFPCWMSLLLKLKREREKDFCSWCTIRMEAHSFFSNFSRMILITYSQWSRKKVYLFHWAG